MRICIFKTLVVLSFLGPVSASGQSLIDPTSASLTLLTPPDQSPFLDKIDGLAFDASGNLFGALEISGSSGGVVSIDTTTGSVTELTTGISRADQIAFDPDSGDFFVTSEITPASTSNRIYKVAITYGGGVPVSAVAVSLDTDISINNPEGIVVLPPASDYGNSGDLLVAEHADPGRILRVSGSSDPAATSTLATGISNGEGMTLHNDMLYVAATGADTVLQVASDGMTMTFGTPLAVGLNNPDNVVSGPDGYLYVSEDLNPGRIIRIASDGTHSVFAQGFDNPQGMAFDAEGTMYISEQGLDRIWMVTPIPEPGTCVLCGLTVFAFVLRRRNSDGANGSWSSEKRASKVLTRIVSRA